MSFRTFKIFLTKKLIHELPDNLSYHGIHHTMEVLNVCNQYIKRLKLNKQESYLLRTAALIHDVGIIWQYFGHEEEAVKYSYKTLPEFGYCQEDLLKIEGIIMATKIPQNPNTIIEMILCDADLDYLGTDQFYTTGETLYREFLAYGVVKDEESWDRIQIQFLSNHHYHTEFAKKYREPKKQKHLIELKKKWNFK